MGFRGRFLIAMDDPGLSIIINLNRDQDDPSHCVDEWRMKSFKLLCRDCVAGEIQSLTELRSSSRLATHLCFHPSHSPLLVRIIPPTIFSIFPNLFWIILSSPLSHRGDLSGYKYWSQTLLWDPCPVQSRFWCWLSLTQRPYAPTIFSVFLNLFWIILSSSVSPRSALSTYKY